MFKSFLLALFAALPAAAADAPKAVVGKAAPAFTLPDSKGARTALADFKGKTVVLEWHNHECPYVVKHYASGNIPSLQRRYTKEGVVWLSVISSAPGKQGHVSGEQADANMKGAQAAPTRVLLDPTGMVGTLYGARTTPHMYIVDGEGVLRYNGAIDSIPSADKADLVEAEPWFAQALDAVLAGEKVEHAVNKPYGCSVKYGKTAKAGKKR